MVTSAIFDKSNCASCHHNSENQASLFGESISSGSCTNKQCFDSKTEAEIQIRADALKDEYQVVRIFRVGENMTVIPLVADGAKGVGTEQAAACKTCKDYGAVVSTVPDKLGRVFKNLCMNVPCNEKMVKANLQSQMKAVQEEAGDGVTSESEGGQDSQNQGAKTGQDASTGGKVAKAEVQASSEPSNRVKEYREKLWRKVYQHTISKLDVNANQMVLIAICLTRPSVLSSSGFKSSLEQLGLRLKFETGPSKLLKVISELSGEQLAVALKQIASNVDSTFGVDDIAGILSFMDIKLEKYWKVDKEFFELLTKNEIDAVCDEIGIKAAIGADYAKLRNGGKGEFIAGVMGLKDFEYRGLVPKLVALPQK